MSKTGLRRILVHHSKSGDVHYDATDSLWAFGQMFKDLDEWSAYIELSKEEKALYAKAKRGNLQAAKTLCEKRRNHEYEGYTLQLMRTKSA